LSKYLPLVLIVDSAGKSLHGWFYCDGLDDAEGGRLHSFFGYAVKLGADVKMWGSYQFSRMPGGTRKENGQRQRVLYFDSKGVWQ
jgi:hypothetical protein